MSNYYPQITLFERPGLVELKQLKIPFDDIARIIGVREIGALGHDVKLIPPI